MSDTPHPYPGIYLSTTDTALPEWFSNNYEKYANFQPMLKGGKGILFSCDDLNLGRKVALKTLAPDVKDLAVERKRLLREARVTAQLAHPNTIPVYEIGITDQDAIYFTMKKVEGESLFDILVRIANQDAATKARYPLEQRINILLQALSALWYAHTHGVIHRDVKPENILVGIFDEVYLMDWGVAKVWGMPRDEAIEAAFDIPESDRITLAGQRPGTPLYMSPEQISGNSTIDERSDIFSFGVVLYECLVQKEPFRGATIEDTFRNILSHHPPPPSEVRPGEQITKALDKATLKALAKDPAERFQSVGELIDTLKTALTRAETPMTVDSTDTKTT